MQAPQTLYGQSATHLVLRLFLKAETNVGGGVVVEAAQTFLSHLVLPGCRLTSLDTKRPGMGPKLNMGEFSDRRGTRSRRPPSARTRFPSPLSVTST